MIIQNNVTDYCLHYVTDDYIESPDMQSITWNHLTYDHMESPDTITWNQRTDHHIESPDI